MKMPWTSLKRNTYDPLIRRFIDRFDIHWLSLPRSNTEIGDLYRYKGSQVDEPGKIKYLLEPTIEISNIITGESYCYRSSRRN